MKSRIINICYVGYLSHYKLDQFLTCQHNAILHISNTLRFDTTFFLHLVLWRRARRSVAWKLKLTKNA